MERALGMSMNEITTIFGLVSLITVVVNLFVACMADRMRRVMTTTTVRKPEFHILGNVEILTRYTNFD